MFLLRAAFWLTIVILLLPGDPEGGDAPRVSLIEALGAVKATIDDLSQFCVRNPDVCATGQVVAETVADKARYGVEQLQGYLAQNADGGEGNLTSDDLQAPWHEPVAAQVAAVPSR